MQRRTFLKLSASGIILSTAGAGLWQSIPVNSEDLSIKQTIAWLHSLPIETLKSHTSWSIPEVLAHMAQSIELSMTTYPVHKPAFFKETIGKAAFSVFKTKRRMIHNLEEHIPGIEEELMNTDAHNMMNRLITALQYFDQFTGEFAEHFAYGALNKSDYALAHVMHIRNHFSQISIAQ